MKTKTARKTRTVADLAANLEASIDRLATAAKPAKAPKAPKFDRKRSGPEKPARKAKPAPSAVVAAELAAAFAAAPPAPRKMSLLTAAYAILRNSECALPVGEIYRRITASGLWSSPAGKTPQQTLYSAILRELGKGSASRFARGEIRGEFRAAL